MGESIDLVKSDLRDVLPRIVETLTSGQSVCVSAGSRSALIANATNAPIDINVPDSDKPDKGVLLLRDASSAGDFLVDASPVARRLMRKCWPGAVQLVFKQGVDSRILEQLSPAVRHQIETEAGLCLNVPQNPLLSEVLQRVPFPILRFGIGNRSTDARTGLTVTNSDSQSVNSEPQIQIDGHQWEWLSHSGLTAEEVARMTTSRILFVCTGNTCRSPMAEGIFRQLLAEYLRCEQPELPEQGFDIVSAGLAAGVGAPASPESVKVCQAHGVDLTHHSSQPLTEELLRSADRIYTMTVGHRDAILSRYPEFADHIKLLSRNGQDVSDPIGWGMAAYQQCQAEITESLQALVEELTKTH